ncbi:tetraacyldisaccharide 4'-kinase [candidate division WOR-3 bacterium]|nr:tetraacyldisaccharide 4'-kinase [candidate division WOR-3 bacterium]
MALYSLDKKIKTVKKTKFQVKTISVGNLECGGTGKTQIVSLILGMFEKNGISGALIARGYGGSYTGFVTPDVKSAGDEVRMISKKHPSVPVVADKNRARGFRLLRDKFPCLEAVLLDDGYQQYGIYKDLEILLLDWEKPKAGGVLPAGRLREPLLASRRADIILFTRAKESVVPPDFSRYPELSDIPKLFCDFKIAAIEKNGKKVSADKRFFLVSSIAKPQRLLKNLSESNFSVGGSLFFRDHHVFSEKDTDKILSGAEKHGCQEILCTEKDAIKLPFECAIIRSQVSWLSGSEGVFENYVMEALK